MMFEPHGWRGSDADKRRYALFEIGYTAIDFAAAVCFIIGSVMFFSESWLIPGTWLFLIGSFLFAAKPTLRLCRELRLAARGEVDTLVRDWKNEE